ncbi:MAG: response regulator [Bryobacterales bacterium]|nr:response regulator [Bryobacterales bacterium]
MITLRVTESAIAALLAVLSAMLWLTGRMYAGFGYWTLAKVLAALGLALMTLFPASPYHTAPMILAALGSVMLSLQACRSFFGRPPRIAFNLALAGACLLSVVYGGVVLRSPQVTILALMLVIGLLYAWTAWVLFRACVQGMMLGKAITAFAFTLLASINLIGALPLARNSTTLSTWMIALTITSQLGLIVASFGFFLMHYERLLQDRELETAELSNLKHNLQETIERKTAELIRAQKLESIGRLAGGMAHDFNNLLAVVHGHANLVQAKMPQGNPLRVHMDKIVNVCEEASSLTERLLAFGRQKSFERGVVQLNQVIQKIEGLTRDVLGARIELITNLDPALGGTLADRGLLRQVLMNLVLNARDAMPRGGTLLIATQNAEVTPGQAKLMDDIAPGMYVALTVTDTGRGMDERTRSRIFEPFFTTKSASQGTGLGLATAYGIVKQCGGYIHVESQPSKGTSFKIFLPRVNEAQAVPAKQESAAPVSARILVVEDYNELRSLIGEVLREEGYTVLEASTGAEALSVVREYRGRLDLVMTDLAMPEMDGQTFADQVRRAHPHLKIVFMSAYPEAVLDHAEGKHHRIPVLRKPFTDADLTARIREVLNPA